jgi:hypothetical protein
MSEVLRECPFCGSKLFSGKSAYGKAIMHHPYCTSCPLSEFDFTDTPGFREHWNSRAQPDNPPQWIAVEDRLPEIKREPEGYSSDEGIAVLVCEKDGYVYEASFWKKLKKFQDGGQDCFPAYWMPLPEPPQDAHRKDGDEG